MLAWMISYELKLQSNYTILKKRLNFKQMSNEQQVANMEPKSHSFSDRFTNAVVKEFTNSNGQISITPFQRKLCQNYFIRLDMNLKDAELKRLAKSEKYRDAVPLTWDNVNMNKLANDVIVYSSIGLDPTQSNHLNLIPYKNNKTGKYDIGFIIGYKGIELKAKKYGYDVPDDISIELVYKNDKFKEIKKDLNNKISSYTFEVVDDFNRGEIVGGFYYHSFINKPEKNKIRVFTKADIDKRKPDNASAEFWGGEKAVWENGKKAGTEVIEGWYEEMAYKTIARAAYNAITIDSEKIDANYLEFIVKQSDVKDLQLANKISAEANKETEDFTDADVVEEEPETQAGDINHDADEDVVDFDTQANFNQPQQGKAPF